MMVTLAGRDVGIPGGGIRDMRHQEGHKFIRAFSSAIGITQVFEDSHVGGGGGFEVGDTLTVGDLLTVTKTSVNKTLKIHLLVRTAFEKKNSVNIVELVPP